ncbi:MAG: hypothetical protein HY288_07020 [Planctomycetia bacterium]|nr:hypothetical protein [Planctomycetia bacterium]
MRFGLKTLLIGTGLLGVALYLLVAAPPNFAVPVLVLISVALAALLTTGVVYGRANLRAFCIGALFPAGGTVIALTWMLCMWFMAHEEMKDFPRLLAFFDKFAFTLRVWSGACWIMGLVVGSVTVGLRLAFQRKAIELQEASGKSDSEFVDEGV